MLTGLIACSGINQASQILPLEFLAPVDLSARDHELSLTAVVKRARTFRRRSHVSLDHFPDEQTVLGNQARLCETAFEVGIALTNQRSGYLLSSNRCEAELFELVELAARAVTLARNRIREAWQ
jgi:hypothetical protein